MQLDNQEITEEMKEEIKKYLEKKWQRRHNDPKPMRCSKSSSKREAYSNTIQPQETRDISNKPNLTPKVIRERRTKKRQSYQKERNHKDQIRNKWKRNEGNNSKDQ